MIYYGEIGYMELMRKVFEEGVETPDRTGVGCKKLFNAQIIWSEGEFPRQTVRPMGIRYAWEEMRLFLSGRTDTKELENKGIMFWAGNTSREFLDTRGMTDYPEGSLGKSYSYQWRNAGGWIDQLEDLVEGLRDNPYSRRHAVDLWGVTEQSEMPLLPCWHRLGCFVEPTEDGENKLHFKLYSRSNDILFGYYQAAMQYRLFQMALCRMLDMKLGDLVTDLLDVHIYKNQYNYVEEMLDRDIGNAGTVELNPDFCVDQIEDILAIEPNDFIISDYHPNREEMKTPRPAVAV